MPVPQSKLNSYIGLATLGGVAVSIVFFVAPLRTLPHDMRETSTKIGSVEEDVAEIITVQAVQTEALKTLADVAKDERETRRDVDRHTAELDSVKRRLDRLESR